MPGPPPPTPVPRRTRRADQPKPRMPPPTHRGPVGTGLCSDGRADRGIRPPVKAPCESAGIATGQRRHCRWSGGSGRSDIARNPTVPAGLSDICWSIPISCRRSGSPRTRLWAPSCAFSRALVLIDQPAQHRSASDPAVVKILRRWSGSGAGRSARGGRSCSARCGRWRSSWSP